MNFDLPRGYGRVAGRRMHTMIAEKRFSGQDGDFFYLDWGGTGPLLHIAHATGFCAGVYTPLAERFTDRLRVAGLDDRGHGRTEAPADPARLMNWDVFARDLENFIEHLGEPVVALGHSRGGTASLKLAVERPDLVKALILVDPTILPLSWLFFSWPMKKLGLAHRIPIATRAAGRRNGWTDREEILAAYRQKAPFKSWAPGFVEGYVEYGFKDKGRGGVSLSCDPAWESRCFATHYHYLWDAVARVRVPCLVVYGRESDTFLPAAVRRFAKTAPQAVMLGLEGVGHFAPMERPDETAEAVLGFLEKNGIL